MVQGAIGHLLGAAGAVEAIFAIKALCNVSGSNVVHMLHVSLNANGVIDCERCCLWLVERHASYTQPHRDNRGILVELRAKAATGEGASRSPFEFVWVWRHKRESFVYQVDTTM